MLTARPTPRGALLLPTPRVRRGVSLKRNIGPRSSTAALGNQQRCSRRHCIGQCGRQQRAAYWSPSPRHIDYIGKVHFGSVRGDLGLVRGGGGCPAPPPAGGAFGVAGRAPCARVAILPARCYV